MKTLSRSFALFILCLLATGCIIEAPELPEDDNPATECGGPHDSCENGNICALVDPCGSPCAADDPELPCAAICIGVYACIEPLGQSETCEPILDHCGEGLACRIDESAGCGPSACREEGCLECPPVFTCQDDTPPSTCDELDCGPGFRCEIEVQEGCGFTDPEGQVRCLAQPTAFCVPVDTIHECEPGVEGACGRSEVCAPDFDQCVPSHCEGEVCSSDCQIPFTCQPAPCDNTECPRGTRCEEVWTEAVCVSEEDHIIGETCADTMCLPGFGCVEIKAYSPCDGSDCNEPVQAHVSCEAIGEPEPGPADECDSDWDCDEGFECRFDQDSGCSPSFCDGEFCTQDCVDVLTCQPVEEPQRPETLVHECDPSADDCASGFSCEVDENAACEPSYCDEDICTDDCRVIFTCQLEQIEVLYD